MHSRQHSKGWTKRTRTGLNSAVMEWRTVGGGVGGYTRLMGTVGKRLNLQRWRKWHSEMISTSWHRAEPRCDVRIWPRSWQLLIYVMSLLHGVTLLCVMFVVVTCSYVRWYLHTFAYLIKSFWEMKTLLLVLSLSNWLLAVSLQRETQTKDPTAWTLWIALSDINRGAEVKDAKNNSKS